MVKMEEIIEPNKSLLPSQLTYLLGGNKVVFTGRYSWCPTTWSKDDPLVFQNFPPIMQVIVLGMHIVTCLLAVDFKMISSRIELP